MVMNHDIRPRHVSNFLHHVEVQHLLAGQCLDDELLIEPRRLESLVKHMMGNQHIRLKLHT